MPLLSLSPQSCQALLDEFHARQAGSPYPQAKMMVFSGVGDRDVYNITAPFEWNGDRFILGRVEPRDSEFSQIWFFREVKGEWHPVEGVEPFDHLQDPCVTFVNGELVLGGVKFPVTLADGSTGWRMEFYRGKTPAQLRCFFTGPDKMKDIRLKQMADGRIAVLTRPQGAKGGRGKIGFAIAGDLDALSNELLEEAPLLDHLFLDSEWGGANEVHLLPGGELGVLGHVACFDEQDHRHYYPMVFSLNPETGEASALRIIAERGDFPPGPSKRADLVDVIFSGGLVRNGDGTATLYAGLSDAAAASLKIDDPFASFNS